jgi:hypothetical protein
MAFKNDMADDMAPVGHSVWPRLAPRLDPVGHPIGHPVRPPSGPVGHGCHADVFGRTDDGRGGVRDLDAL